jgi:Ca2+-binding EF-hand superfamily protein
VKYFPLLVCVAGALATSAAVAEKAGDSKWSEEAQFKMMDANGDGKVTTAEHAAGARNMFVELDADKDGKVTAPEMDAAHAGMKSKGEHAGKHHEMSSAQKIAVIDKNKDGAVSAEEHAKGSKEMFGKMDADRSGDLTWQECKEGHEKLMTASEGE